MPPERELPLTIAPAKLVGEVKGSTPIDRTAAGGGGRRPTLRSTRDGGIDDDRRQPPPVVVLVPEDELFAIEVKREDLKRCRRAIVEACSKVQRGTTGGSRG